MRNVRTSFGLFIYTWASVNFLAFYVSYIVNKANKVLRAIKRSTRNDNQPGVRGGVSSYPFNDIKSSDRLRFLELTKCSPIRANHDKFI